jgi:hypothetical protein
MEIRIPAKRKSRNRPAQDKILGASFIALFAMKGIEGVCADSVAGSRNVGPRAVSVPTLAQGRGHE